MKRLFLFALVITSILTSCTGEDGVPGRNGLDGLDGYSAESASFEISERDFTSVTKFETFYDFPKPILADDHILVYRLIGRDASGKDVWAALPEYQFNQDGLIDYNYNFDFSVNNVRIYLKIFDFSKIDDSVNRGQIFRIVSVPGYPANRSASSVNYKDYYAVIKYYNIDESKIIKTK